MSSFFKEFDKYNDNFKDNKGRQFFLKDRQKKLKYIIPESLKEVEITNKDDIVLPFAIDTEFTEYSGNPKHLNLEILAQNKNKLVIQKDIIDAAIKNLSGYSFDDIVNNKISKISTEILDKSKNIKQKPTLHLTTQIQHIFYLDSATIFINPNIKSIYEENVEDPELHYPSYIKENGFHVIDYLQQKGFDVRLHRLNPDISNEDMLKVYENMKREDQGKIRTLTFKPYAYWLNADWFKVFSGDFLEDMLLAIRKAQIQLRRRLIANGNQSRLRPKWFIIINGLVYKVAIDFADLGALQGATSYSNVLENLDMTSKIKKSLDSNKDNMFFAMLKYPMDFKQYALNDLTVYEALKRHNELLRQTYINFEVEEFFVETKLTTGATVNDLQTAILLKQLGYTERTKKGEEELSSLTKLASPQNVQRYIDIGHKKKSGVLARRRVAAKTAGGRCYNNLHKIHMSSTAYSICDIDISGAYPTIAASLDYMLGSPVILNFNKGKVSLGEFKKYYDDKMSKRAFKLIVETVNGELLEDEQDLLPSFPHFPKNSNIWYDSNGDLHIANTVDTINISTAIYTKELHNTPICHDELDFICKEMSKKQRDDILDKAKMVCAIFYPKEFECDSIEELRIKIEQHKIDGKGRFNYIMNGHVQLDNEEGEYPHYWYKINVGKLMLNPIIQKRAEYKKTNPSLAIFYKLVGNTFYGINVSSLFENSNLILAANITSMCRMAMWCIEKSLNISQTITDGGVFDLNEVIHKIEKRSLDTRLLTRGYLQNKRDMSRDKKWNLKPITKDGKKIEYIEGIGWIMDGVNYPYNKGKLIELETIYNDLVNELGDEHQKTIEDKILYEKEILGLKAFKDQINKIVVEHVKETFPKVDLFNGTFNKCKTDDKGIALKDDKGNYIYEELPDLLKFEVKNLCSEAIFHGSANYLYINISDEKSVKMRGYEKNKNITSFYLKDNNIVLDEKHYLEIPPINMFLSSLNPNPEAVPIPSPFIKSCILKPAEYGKNYVCTWSKSLIKPGDTYYKVVNIPIHSLRYKFLTYTQHKAWNKYEKELKRKNGGLGFEVFYINQDGTINYKKMVEEIDSHIRSGLIYPRKIYDKDMHFYRNLKLKKNQHVQKTILDHITLVNKCKIWCRILIVGPVNYLLENAKYNGEDETIMRDTPKYIKSEHHDFFEHINKYSDNNEFRDIDLRFAL